MLTIDYAINVSEPIPILHNFFLTIILPPLIKKPLSSDNWIKYLVLQYLITLLMATLFWGISNNEVALAVLTGGLISCFSNLIFAGWFFSVSGFAQKSKKILSAFYVAEGLKIFFTAVFFAAVILYLHLLLLPLFVAYFIIHLSFSFIALVPRKGEF
jgi:F0F1-type ATP synthase assembly protein I